jgi:hypothetical protein
MAKNNQTKTESKTIEPETTITEPTTTIESLLGVDTQPMEEYKVNEFAAVGKLQVLGLRELLMSETFGTLLANLGPMVEPRTFNDHKDLIKQHLKVALEVSMMVGQVYDEHMGV